MNPQYTELNSCLACGGKDLVLILDLGKQPLANSYHRLNEKLKDFPLALMLCASCFHSQLSVAVSPDLMFKNYLYVSGTSRTLREYFDWFADMAMSREGMGSAPVSVLDIASNDGSQLGAFRRYTSDLTGVDPAQNLKETAEKTGATIVCDYWSEEVAQRQNRMFDIIIAQNVFAHNANPLGFLNAARRVMHPGSRLYIQTSQAEMFSRGEFDTIYHEHISFFCANSMRTLAHRGGCVIEDVFTVPVHGTSYVFVLSAKKDTNEDAITMRIKEEKAAGRASMKLYEQFAETAHRVVKDLAASIEKHRSEGYAIVGFGAAAKGNTLLNFGNIALDYIIDENPLKQKLYTPGMNILIEPPERLIQEKRPALVIPLAWNFFEEIYKKTKGFRPRTDDRFLLYFPSLSIRE